MAGPRKYGNAQSTTLYKCDGSVGSKCKGRIANGNCLMKMLQCRLQIAWMNMREDKEVGGMYEDKMVKSERCKDKKVM